MGMKLLPGQGQLSGVPGADSALSCEGPPVRIQGGTPIFGPRPFHEKSLVGVRVKEMVSAKSLPSGKYAVWRKAILMPKIQIWTILRAHTLYMNSGSMPKVKLWCSAIQSILHPEQESGRKSV